MKLMSRRWVAALAAVPLLLLSLVTLQSSTVLASGNPDFKLVWWPSSTATNAGSDVYTDGWSSTSGSSLRCLWTPRCVFARIFAK